MIKSVNHSLIPYFQDQGLPSTLEPNPDDINLKVDYQTVKKEYTSKRPQYRYYVDTNTDFCNYNARQCLEKPDNNHLGSHVDFYA